RQEHGDPPHALGLLCARRERPRRHAAEERDEIAPSHHSITSSARTRNDSEITSPIDLAVLRLTSKSSLTGSSIGKLPAFAPLRILSTNVAARRKFSATLNP